MALTMDDMKKQMELMQQHMEQMQQQMERSAVVSTSHTKKPDRPSIQAGIDDREWALFIDTWARYKSMTKITLVGEIRMELRSSCSEEVNKMLFEFVGPDVLNSCTEDDLLAHIKSVAVRNVHVEVHRRNFNTMTQNDGESITSYVARLRSQAVLCVYRKKCPCAVPADVSFADEMVSQRLIAGLANQEHQRRLLSEAGTLKTLNDKIERLRVLETTEESTNVLHGESKSAVAKSTYKRENSSQKKNGTKCKWCGRTSHPKGKPLSDRKFCPALEKNCHKCNEKGHLANVCGNLGSANALREPEQQNRELTSEIPAGASVSFGFSTDFRRGADSTNPR